MVTYPCDRETHAGFLSLVKARPDLFKDHPQIPTFEIQRMQATIYDYVDYLQTKKKPDTVSQHILGRISCFDLNQYPQEAALNGVVIVDIFSASPRIVHGLVGELNFRKEFVGVGGNSPNFHFMAFAEIENGYLEIETKLVHKGKLGNLIRDPNLPHFADLFGSALNYFSRGGIAIHKLGGIWPNKFSNGESTNYLVFKKLVDSGMPWQEAAFLTPTGKLAKRHGFTKVILGMDHGQKHPYNKNGANVVFHRD